MGVGTMRDYMLKLRDLLVSHTLGYVGEQDRLIEFTESRGIGYVVN